MSSSSDAKVQRALSMMHTGGRGGSGHSNVGVNAVFVRESRYPKYATQLYMPLETVQVPFVKTQSKGGNSTSKYVKLDPVVATAVTVPAHYTFNIRVFGQTGAGLTPGKVVNLQGLHYEVSADENGVKRFGVHVDKIQALTVPLTAVWPAKERGMHRPVDQQRALNLRRRQLIQILVVDADTLMKPVEEGGVGLAALLDELDTDWTHQSKLKELHPSLAEVEACLEWNSPDLVVHVPVDQTFSVLKDPEAATQRLKEQGDVAVIHTIPNMSWMYTPVRNKQECPPELCLQGPKQGDEKRLPGFKVEVVHADTNDGTIKSFFFDTKFYHSDLAQLGLCVTGKKRTFSLATLALYADNIARNLHGVFMGRRMFKATEDMQQTFGAEPDEEDGVYYTKSIFLGDFTADVGAFARDAGMRVPPEHMLTFVTTLLGGTTLSVSDEMNNLKKTAPHRFDLVYSKAINLDFVKGDITPLIMSTDVDMYLVVAGTEAHELVAKFDANMKDFGDKGLGLFLDKLENVPFALFAVVKPECGMSLDSIMHLGVKRARIEGSAAA